MCLPHFGFMFRYCPLCGKELEFWKEMAPKLARGTPSAKTISWDRERVLELRLATIRVAIRTLEKLCYEECVDVVLEHLDFWRTTPKMILQGQRSTVDQCHRTLRVFIGPH